MCKIKDLSRLPWYVLEQSFCSFPYNVHLAADEMVDPFQNVWEWMRTLSLSSTSLQFQVHSTLGGARSHVYMAMGGSFGLYVTFPVFKPRHNEVPRLNRRPRDTHFHLWLGSSHDLLRLRDFSRTPRHLLVPSRRKAKSSDSTGAVYRERETAVSSTDEMQFCVKSWEGKDQY